MPQTAASLPPGRVGDTRRGGWFVIVAVGFVAAGAWGGAIRAEDDVLVTIRGPLVGRVGEKVSFDVELVNRSGRALEKLRVIDYFDAGFKHEASQSPIEQKGTVDLAVGTARRVTLEFILAEPGRQCHRVEILDPSQRFVGGATECVQVTPAVPTIAQQPSQPPSAPATSVPAPTQMAPPPAVVVPSPATVAAPLATAAASTSPITPPASPALALVNLQ